MNTVMLNTKRTDAAGLGRNCGQRASRTVRTYSAQSETLHISPQTHKAFQNTSLSQQLIAVKTFIKATILIQSTSIPAEAGRVQPWEREREKPGSAGILQHSQRAWRDAAIICSFPLCAMPLIRTLSWPHLSLMRQPGIRTAEASWLSNNPTMSCTVRKHLLWIQDNRNRLL